MVIQHTVSTPMWYVLKWCYAVILLFWTLSVMRDSLSHPHMFVNKCVKRRSMNQTSDMQICVMCKQGMCAYRAAVSPFVQKKKAKQNLSPTHLYCNDSHRKMGASTVFLTPLSSFFLCNHFASGSSLCLERSHLDVLEAVAKFT